MPMIASISDLESKMRTAILKFAHAQTMKGEENTYPKFIYLGKEETSFCEAMLTQNCTREMTEAEMKRYPARAYMGVEVLYLRDKETHLAVGS